MDRRITVIGCLIVVLATGWWAQARTVATMMSGAGTSTAGGGAPYSDDFNRSNEDPLASPWAWSSGGTTGKLSSNQVIGRTDWTTHLAYYNSWTDGDNQCSQVKIITTNGYMGPAVRISATADTCYWWGAGGALMKRIAGTDTSLANIYTFTAGDTVKLCISGTTLSGAVNATTWSGNTDSDISTGKPGFKFVHASDAIDDWAGTVP